MKKQNTAFTFNFFLFTLPALWAASGSTAQYDIRITQYEIRSIKNNKLCKTNPIYEMSEMNLTPCLTMNYDNKSALLTMEKQTQSNPTCSELVEPISKWRKPYLTAGTLAHGSLKNALLVAVTASAKSPKSIPFNSANRFAV